MWLGTVALAWLALLSGCHSIEGDLIPSGADARAFGASSGIQPGQQAPDFTSQDTLNQPFHLADHLAGGATPADAVVLYFTMWCPVCLSHSDHLIYSTLPAFQGRGTVRWLLVDYVSGSVAQARASESANGYAGGPLITLADVGQPLYSRYNAAMGTVVVIDRNGVVRLNEDYKDGRALAQTLDALLPP